MAGFLLERGTIHQYIAHLTIILVAALYRHSGCYPTVIPAQAGIRRRVEGKGLVFSVPFGIPAYAGMTVGAAGKTVEVSPGRTTAASPVAAIALNESIIDNGFPQSANCYNLESVSGQCYTD